jgi:fluoride exporter
MTKWLLIAGGGALGSVFRYALHTSVQRVWGGNFPLGTLTVNLIGCLLIGVLAALFAGPIQLREEYGIGLGVGLLGGFTTFSTFGLESFLLMNAGQFALAILNILLSCGIGLLAVWLGFRLGGIWFGAAA